MLGSSSFPRHAESFSVSSKDFVSLEIFQCRAATMTFQLPNPMRSTDVVDHASSEDTT